MRHDLVNGLAELFHDPLAVLGIAILQHVMQQPRDGLILRAAVLDDQGRDRHGMVDVGAVRPLAHLPGMRLGGQGQRGAVAGGEMGHGVSPSDRDCARRTIAKVSRAQ